MNECYRTDALHARSKQQQQQQQQQNLTDRPASQQPRLTTTGLTDTQPTTKQPAANQSSKQVETSDHIYLDFIFTEQLHTLLFCRLAVGRTENATACISGAVLGSSATHTSAASHDLARLWWHRPNGQSSPLDPFRLNV